MLKAIVSNVLFLLPIITLIQANFDFKLKYCRFKCTDECEPCNEEAKESDPAGQPEAFYFRDFYGVIPPDAYPLGTSNQFPQTYIGMVFDPVGRGLYITTIIGGLDYVHNVVNGSANKISKNIQILCTMEPERFIWVRLTSENSRTLTGVKYPLGGFDFINNGKSKFFRVTHYIAKSSKCMVTYAGTIKAIGNSLEYALMDGTVQVDESVMWLVYKTQTTKEDSEKKKVNKPRPFISHHYEYNIRPDSIIPEFFKQLNFGPCSITCTNRNTNKDDKFKKDIRFQASMGYYWQSSRFIDIKHALKVGLDFGSKPLYVGQTLTLNDAYEIGSFQGSRVSIGMSTYAYVEDRYIHVLCTTHPELLEWVKATAATFPSLNQSRLIPGGRMANDTQVFIGRDIPPAPVVSGSVRVFEDGATLNTIFGNTKEFEVLMFKDQE